MSAKGTKNKGKVFEDKVKEALLKLPNVDVTRLRDAPKKQKNVDNPSDFIVYKYPHEIYLECKSHLGNSLPFRCIRSQQMVQMIKKTYIEGVRAGIIVWFIDKDVTAWIPVQELFPYWFSQDKKSLSVQDIEKLQGVIYIQGKKKRVYYDYDFEPFFNELYND